jgi:hypothetical protein
MTGTVQSFFEVTFTTGIAAHTNPQGSFGFRCERGAMAGDWQDFGVGRWGGVGGLGLSGA